MPWGPGPWMSEPTRKFITEEVPKRTKGALEIKWFYPGEHPYAYTDILLALQEGAAQMGVTLGSYSGGLDSRLEAHELPFLMPQASGAKYLEFMDLLKAEVWNPMMEKSWGAKIVAFQLHPPNQIITDVPVDKPNALAGKKIRSFGLTGNLWIESLGGTGVSMAYPEVATALATGTVDGGMIRYLWTPLRLGPVETRNRIVFSAHLTNYARDGLPTEQHAAYYAARAAGGTGLIITEEHSTHPTDWPYEKLIHGFHRDVIPGYRRITDAVHRHRTPIFAQINHNGGQASSMYSRLPVWAPSPVADPLFREVPKAVTTAAGGVWSLTAAATMEGMLQVETPNRIRDR